jgi:hypothetical protein
VVEKDNLTEDKHKINVLPLQGRKTGELPVFSTNLVGPRRLLTMRNCGGVFG